MKSWFKTALCFSGFIAAITFMILCWTKPEETWKFYSGFTLLSFVISTVILSLFGYVFEDNKQESINTDIKDGDIFYYYGDYYFGYSRVERVEVLDAATQSLRSTYAFANYDGEIITKWYQMATEFLAPGVAAVAEDVKGTLMWNFINTSCEYLINSWVYKIADNITDDKIKVFWNDGTINFLDLKEGKLMWKEWKKSVG